MLNFAKKKDTALVGLEIEAGSIAAAEVATNGTSRLVATAVAPLAPGAFHDGEVTDSDAVASALRALFSEHKLSHRVRLGIANQRVVVRTMRLPAIEDAAELDTAVRSQAHEQIPMPIEQAVLDYRVVGGAPAEEGMPPQLDVVVVAARRDMIEATLKPLKDAGLEPVGVDLSAFALIRALGEAAAPPAEDAEESPGARPTATLYCNVGDVTNLAIARGRSCLFTRVSPTGLEEICASLCSTTGLSEQHARMWLSHVGLAQPLEQVEGDPAIVSQTREAIETGASQVLDELRLSLDFYGGQEGALAVERVVLGGAGSAIPGFAEWMAPILGLPISVGLPRDLASIEPGLAARLTLPYGLALDG